jgi:membrane protein
MHRFFLDGYERLQRFLHHGVWSADLREISRVRALLYQTTRFLSHAVSGFLEDQCLLRASALTYTSLLSLVPFLALMFSVLKGLGVQRRLEPLLLEQFTPASQDVVASILEYVDRTNVTSLGVLGVVFLLVTALMTLKNMEGSFNWIWKVQQGRSWLRTVSDYVSLLVIAPFCFLVALSLTTYFSGPSMVERMESIWIVGGFYRFIIRLSPCVVLWIAFTACYLIMPNTRVKIPAAALGGVVAGTLWQLAQWGYVHYQIGVGKYNAIYGALSQLPILLVWIYLSWVIVLLGAELAFAHQNLYHYTAQRAMAAAKVPTRTALTLGILQSVGERFLSGRRPFRASELAGALQADLSHLGPCLARLERLGWISPREDGEMVVFQRPPEFMPLRAILGWPEELEEPLEPAPLRAVLEKAQGGVDAALGEMTVLDFLRLSGSGHPQEPPEG